MNKVYYDGDASKIIGERLILELIQEKKIKIIDNKVWCNICHNKGNTREMAPVFTLGGEFADCMYEKAFEGSWICRCENGDMKIDYDYHKFNIYKKEDEDNDNRTFEKSICESNNGES